MDYHNEYLDPLMKLQMCTPQEAKAYGRKNPTRDGWDRMKIDVMSSVVWDKFHRNIALREKLLATGDKYIEETNHWNDTFWGVCNGKGHNNLGKILMGIRSYWTPFYPELFNKKKVTPLF